MLSYNGEMPIEFSIANIKLQTERNLTKIRTELNLTVGLVPETEPNRWSGYGL
jgi:hypothetical protein